MKVLFLNLPFKHKISRSSRWPEETKSGTLYYPFWLAYAAGVAEKAGLEINLIDAIAKNWNIEKTISAINSFDPDLLVCEMTTPTYYYDCNFLKQLKKKNNKCRIVVAGTHVSALPQHTLNDCRYIDIIAIEEYDYTIPDIANNLNNLDKVTGIVWRHNNKIIINKPRQPITNLDEIPFVSKIYKKFLNVNDYFYALAQKPMIQILSSRGCPNKCTFCQYPQTFSGRMFRPRSAKNFVEELIYIKKNIPEIKEIFIEDDTFTIDKERVKEICNLIIKNKLKIIWSANVRADLSYELMQLMKKAGCRLLVVGYESGDQNILDNIKKGITIEQSIKFAKNAKKAGLKVFGCFMIGLPGETKETAEKTFDLAKKTIPDMAFFQQAVPFPGTEFYDWAKKNNYLIAENYSQWLNKQGQLNFIVSYPSLSAQDIAKLRDKFMIQYYFSLNYWWRTIIYNRNKEEIKRIIKAALTYLKFLFKKYAKI